MNRNRKVVQGAILTGALAIMTTVTGANTGNVLQGQEKTAAIETVYETSSTAGVVKYLGEAATDSLKSASINVLQNEVVLVAEGEVEDEDGGVPAAGASLLPETVLTTAVDGSIDTVDTVTTALLEDVTETEAEETESTETVETGETEADASFGTIDPDTGVATEVTAAHPDWELKLMAVVEDSLNVRETGSEEAAVIGKLYAGAVADIVEQGDGWTRIQSGNVDGYVRSDLCVTGDAAYDYAQENCTFAATTLTGGLRFRAEATEDADIISTLEEGTVLTVSKDTEAPEGWVAVTYSGSSGYVSAEYVEISAKTITALTVEEEQAKLEAEQKEKAKSEQVQATGSATNSGATAASYDDVTLLAALIQCEAGSQPYEGQVAVGNVVINRLRSGAYGGSIYSVIYAPGQFSPAASGAVARVAAAGPGATARAAAQAALNGENYIGACTQFRNVACGHPGTVIGAHVFW